uniref:Uncharacterized protein n=1 Tax=Lotus japonicus TaxID=34305 RepID=I3SPV7_LOTJA|nr:unknown [Lotus japonicus]
MNNCLFTPILQSCNLSASGDWVWS